jgi:hypothetical protein
MLKYKQHCELKAELAKEKKEWKRAAPFTLTLDVDLKSIGDKEAFKEEVAKDIANAAGIEVKHVQISALRAGRHVYIYIHTHRFRYM